MYISIFTEPRVVCIGVDNRNRQDSITNYIRPAPRIASRIFAMQVWSMELEYIFGWIVVPLVAC